MGVVSCGIGGLVVAHVGRRLLLGRSPRQCAMPRHNGKSCLLFLINKAGLKVLFYTVRYYVTVLNKTFFIE